MQRNGWISMAVLAALTTAALAEPQPKVSKVGENHNSYTYYNYKKASPKGSSTAAAAAPAIPAANKDYSEVNVAAPRLEAVPRQANYDPTYAQPPHQTPPPLTPPSPQVVQDPAYTQTYNPGPSLPANQVGSFQSSIYSLGPNYYPYAYPYPYNTGFYPGYNGLYNGISVTGYYNNRNGLTVRAGFPGYYNQGFYGPNYNLTPQRFDPQPGEHPYSIQQPRPRCR